MEVRRVRPRDGYDLWAEEYDAASNPVVRLDERVTPPLLAAVRGGLVLDAGCGTGRHFPGLLAAGCRVVGLVFSPGMLRVARRKHPGVPLLLADLRRPWPLRAGAVDAVLCALVGEHLDDLGAVCGEMRRVVAPGRRVLFAVYHPAMAEAGKEAHFERGGVDFRLGAERHALGDRSEGHRKYWLRAAS